jgi:hypothetical protein
MRTKENPVRRHLALLLLVALAAVVAGCFNPFDPRVSTERAASSPAPAPSTPQNTVKLFAWCWQHRDPARYAEVFTYDYRFIFALNDSAGNPFRDRPWLREDEMNMAQHMFTGGADVNPASDVTIAIDNLLITTPDQRPGRDFKWHKTIRTHVDLKVTVTDANGTPSVTPVSGYALFFLVRGDSAVIPPELIDQGFHRDSTRWWIERWEDQTVGTAGPGAARPATRLGARADAPPAPYPWPPANIGQLKRFFWPVRH